MNALSLLPKNEPMARRFGLFDDDWFSPVSRINDLFNVSDMSSNLYETDDTYIVQISAPGIDAENAEISVDGTSLTVRADYVVSAPEGATPVWTTATNGSLYQSFRLPRNVSGNDAVAEYKSGILTIRLPKAETSKSIKISVNQ